MATREQNYEQESQDAPETHHCSVTTSYHCSGWLTFGIGMDVRKRRVKSFSKRGDKHPDCPNGSLYLKFSVAATSSAKYC